MQGEPGDLANPVIERLVTCRQRLQCEHLATLLRPDGDAVGDRRTQELFHRPGFDVIASQVAVFRVRFQQALAFQVATDTLRQERQDDDADDDPLERDPLAD